MKLFLKKLLCTALTLALVLQLCPVYALDAGNGNAPDAKESASSNQDGVSTTVFAEETSLREESVKHFRMSDGTYTAVQYPFSTHYSSESGWQDYDNTPNPSRPKQSMVISLKTAAKPAAFPQTAQQILCTLSHPEKLRFLFLYNPVIRKNFTTKSLSVKRIQRRTMYPVSFRKISPRS